MARRCGVPMCTHVSLHISLFVVGEYPAQQVKKTITTDQWIALHNWETGLQRDSANAGIGRVTASQNADVSVLAPTGRP